MSATRTHRSAFPAGFALNGRATIVAALGGARALSWLYLWQIGGRTPRYALDLAICARTGLWGPVEFLLTELLWLVMMTGMMLPSAAPMILTFAKVSERRRAQNRSYVATAVFAVGYLVAWAGLSLGATSAQWSLEQLRLLSPATETVSPVVGAILFFAAGLYQLTPMKSAHLEKCRSPLDLVLNGWREGAGGAFVMGIEQGLHCLACCWLLMALMFVGGVMNLLWMAGIAIFVFCERLFPAGQWIARGGGLAMIAFAAYLLTQAASFQS